MRRWVTLFAVVPACVGVSAASIEPLPYRVPARMPDVAQLLSPGDAHLDGFLGARVAHSEKNRLLKVDLGPLLAGFRHRPGVQPWIGEHIGKWLDAATLAWAYTGDSELRRKMDYAVTELLKCQEPDGYLGTYPPDKRFGLYPGADWDVWVHKYDLTGLLTYYQYTGNLAALAASRKIGDLLVRTFGPGKRSILSAGTHVGMAATSILGPMVLLYRDTGDPRYLQFARYIVRSWSEPHGPEIIATLLRAKSVARTANGKAYEMLSNLEGLCELARATGNRRYLKPVILAWDDVVAHRLYLTGSASQGEHFHGDFYLPNGRGANPCETCVTVTWLRLTAELIRLTGEARFGDQIERTLFNHLAAAQRPDGAEWCYFTPLLGTKPYGPGISCCVSSGPRGMAMAPQFAYLRIPGRHGAPDGLAVNLFEDSRATVTLSGSTVRVAQQTRLPAAGGVTVTLHPEQPATFALRVRTPAWARPLTLSVNGRRRPDAAFWNGWTLLPAREWQDGDRVQVQLQLRPEVVRGDHGNAGKAALVWGPFVLAYDAKLTVGSPGPGDVRLVPRTGRPPFVLRDAKALRFVADIASGDSTEPRAGVFVPFANAGSDGGRYAVWLPTGGSPPEPRRSHE
jgi:uncharacterized protein